MEKKKLTDAVVVPVMTKHNITREEAEKRLRLLFESGILPTGSPDDPETQEMIDDFLSLSSEEGAAKVLFEKTLNECLGNENLIKEYDRLRPKAHMAYTLKQIEGGKMNKREEREAGKQFKMFGDFVREFIFSRLVQDNPHPGK